MNDSANWKWVGYSDHFQGEQRERQQDRDNCVGHTLTSSGGTEVLPSGRHLGLRCRRGDASDQCGFPGPQTVDDALGVGETLFRQRNQFCHRGVRVGEDELGGDEAWFQTCHRQGVRKPRFRVVPSVAGRAFGVAPTAAGECDELAAAEQGACVSASMDSPGAMRWSIEALTLLGAPKPDSSTSHPQLGVHEG